MEATTEIVNRVNRNSDRLLRFAGVLEKRNGNWVIVQIHASMPVEGQAVEY